VTELSDHAFRVVGIHRLFAEVFDWDHGSMRVLERAGFRREGVVEQGAIKDGRILDEVRFAKLTPYLDQEVG